MLTLGFVKVTNGYVKKLELKIPRGLPCTSSILVLGTSKIKGFSKF
jgi:hypothetical protein